MNNNIRCRHYLFQKDLIVEYPKCLLQDEWTVLYEKVSGNPDYYESSSALVPCDKVPEILKCTRWDFLSNDVRPEFIFEDDGRPKYRRHDWRTGIRPIFHHREFLGSHPEYFEISEGFRLCHNLAELVDARNMNKRTLAQVSEDGSTVDVVQISQNKIRAKTSHLQQYQNHSDLCLVLYINSIRHSAISIDTINKQNRKIATTTETHTWEFRIDESWDRGRFSTCSKFSGKAVLFPSAGHGGETAPSPRNLTSIRDGIP